MKTYNQVGIVLSHPEAISNIKSMIKGPSNLSLTVLADNLCKQYGLYDPRGLPQIDRCRRVLRMLGRAGDIVLPGLSRRTKTAPHKSISAPVQLPIDVPEKVGEVRGLKTILVKSAEHKAVWNELVTRDTSKGVGSLVGRELRYLVASDHGFLGAIEFGSAALHLDARDKWIGWDIAARRTKLHQVIAMRQFLIRPQVQCPDLAALVLQQVLGVVADDFEKRYNLWPLLVECSHKADYLSANDFHAASWVRVGQTKVRGRFSPARKMAVENDIYLYPLEKEFRSKMGLPPHSGLGGLGISDGLSADTWARQEFGGAQLGDKRITDRLVSCASDMAKLPTRSISGAVQGEASKVKGYYRMIDHPDEDAINMDTVLSPHRGQTIRRMMEEKTVLAIQDGSDLNYSGLNDCEGLGVIGSNQTGAESNGLHLHSTLVVTTEGLPLGILRATCEARKPKSEDDKRLPANIPIEEKKTFAWIESMRDLKKIALDMPGTRIISVKDREADFYELFEEHRKDRCPNLEMLVRAKHNRWIIESGTSIKLFDAVKETPECARFKITVARKSARPKKSKQKASPKRPERIADVSLRYMPFELRPSGSAEDRTPISISIVHVVENNPPEGEEAIEWFLLTTIDVQSAEVAEKCLLWYCKRWRIEDWHRVLKSGCRIEEAANKSAERLERFIAINLVIAWRIMLMTLLGRESPDLPPEVLFTDVEIEVLTAFAKGRRLKPPDTVGDAVQLVARIGGYLARKSDPPPGHQLMWQGYSALQMMCAGYILRC